VTISVTANAAFSPPRNEITVSVPVGKVMSSVQVWRIVNGVRTNLRVQPSPGFDSRVAYDYEAPYGASVTYGWTSNYTDPAGYTTVFNETWASTAAWTPSGTGTWTVSGGTVRNPALTSFQGSQLKRFAPTEAYRRLTIGSLVNTSATGTISIDVLGDTGSTFAVSRGAGESFIRVNGAATTIAANAAIVIDTSPGVATLSGTGGSYVKSIDRGIRSVVVHAESNATASSAATMQAGSIFLQDYIAPVTITETSSPVSLNAADTWLVHPASPGRSFRITQMDPTYATLNELGDITNASNATIHRILGSDKPVTTTTGNRAADETSMTITTYTSQAVADLMACLADEVPLLINTPVSWDNDFKYAFYQVGPVARKHVSNSNVYKYRTITLPLLEVQSPTVVVENTGWSYASLAVEFATYTSLLPKFATYADLAANTRM